MTDMLFMSKAKLDLNKRKSGTRPIYRSPIILNYSNHGKERINVCQKQAVCE